VHIVLLHIILSHNAKKKIAYPEDLSSDESDVEENIDDAIETSTVTSVIDREDLMQIAIGLLYTRVL